MPEAPTVVQMSEWSRFNLSVQEVREKIEELHLVRSRRRKWLVGTSLWALGITTACLLITRSAALSLLEDGPTHDEFVADLTREITKQVLPQMDDYGFQASCATLPFDDPSLPIVHHPHASRRASVTSEVQVGGEKPNAEICEATDDPEKPLGHFREQTVSEYQTTLTKIVNDLTTIRGGEGNSDHPGLSATAVAGLFVNRVEEGLPKPSPANYSSPGGTQLFERRPMISSPARLEAERGADRGEEDELSFPGGQVAVAYIDEQLEKARAIPAPNPHFLPCCRISGFGLHELRDHRHPEPASPPRCRRRNGRLLLLPIRSAEWPRTIHKQWGTVA